MKNILKTKILSSLAMILLLSCNAHSKIHEHGFEFKEYSNQDGVIVYKSTSKNEDGVMPIKGQTLIKAKFQDVKTFLDDFTIMKSWVPDLKELRIKNTNTNTNTKNHIIQYLRYNAPWPFSDRVFLLDMHIQYNKSSKRIKYLVKSIEDNAFPIEDDFVRGETHYGYLEAIYIDDKTTQIKMFIFSDLKGFIPKWIMSYVQLSWPGIMFSNIRSKLEKKI